MGDYANTTPAPPTTAYGAYKSHFSLKKEQTDVVLMETLRDLYPNKHITCVPVSSANLMEFADAGKAQARLIRDGDEFLSTRGYVAPVGRLRKSDGKLTEAVKFGLFEYTYESEKFPLYIMSWSERGPGCAYIMQYLLCEQVGVGADGYHPSADKLLKAAGKYSSELHKEIYVFDGGSWRKNRQLWDAVQSASWDDVILDPAMKDTLIRDVNNFFDSRATYEEHGVPWKRGIILHGTPGCGKTISIKALMNTLEKRDVASLYVKSFKAANGPQQSIRSIFQQARLMAPCILILEDLDSLVVDEVRSYFLNELDGLEDNNGMLIIGSTNHLERLDPGISKRPSRFDRKYHYKLPGERERILYCQYWRTKLAKSGKIDFPEEICPVVAQLTDGFSFAYMKELFVQTLLSIVGGHADADEEEDENYVTVIDVVAEETKIIDGSAKLAKEGETTESTQDKGNQGEKKAALQMPQVEIPDGLKSHSLMRILHKQAKALWRDMDNTEDEIYSRAKLPGTSGPTTAHRAVRMGRRMLGQN